MSTDRELLELAAKAAGYEKLHVMPVARDRSFYMIEEAEGDRFAPWNPLTDDGDALRLAVKLDIPISPESCNGTVWICRGDLQIFEALGVDSGAAVRRAIVRAAAEIGRTMP